MRLELDVQEINAVMALLASLMDKIRMQAQAQRAPTRLMNARLEQIERRLDRIEAGRP